MKRILPNDRLYKRMPCSVVALGCALKLSSQYEVAEVMSDAARGRYGDSLKDDGYLSLKGANGLIRAYTSVTRRDNFKKGQRPCLRDFCHGYNGKAIVCVLGHFVYIEGGNYYSYFFNGDDKVVSVWYLD